MVGKQGGAGVTVTAGCGALPGGGWHKGCQMQRWVRPGVGNDSMRPEREGGGEAWWGRGQKENLQVHEASCAGTGAGTVVQQDSELRPTRGSWIGDFVCGPREGRGVCILIPHPTWGREAWEGRSSASWCQLSLLRAAPREPA